jgi:hypothetical protein
MEMPFEILNSLKINIGNLCGMLSGSHFTESIVARTTSDVMSPVTVIRLQGDKTFKNAD